MISFNMPKDIAASSQQKIFKFKNLIFYLIGGFFLYPFSWMLIFLNFGWTTSSDCLFESTGVVKALSLPFLVPYLFVRCDDISSSMDDSLYALITTVWYASLIMFVHLVIQLVRSKKQGK